MTDWLHDAALAEFKEAMALEPGDPWSYALMAWTLTSAGRPAEALAHIRTAMRLDPHYPPFFGFVLGLTEFSLERLQDAVATLEASIRLNPDYQAPFLLLGAIYGHLGRKENAAAAIARYNEITLGRGGLPLTISNSPPLDLSKETHRTRFFAGLRLAGVPDTLSEGAFAAKNRLAGEEIRALILGQRLRGRSLESGEEHAATVSADGMATLTGDWASLGGGTMTETSVRIGPDELCFVWQKVVNLCGPVLRNPGGAKATENEFIWSPGGNAYTFSQVD
jgi:hypothetical protein